MSIIFTVSEVLDIAVGIEKRGIAVYEIVAKSVDNHEARKTFEHLADMEREHIQIFQGMLKEADKF